MTEIDFNSITEELIKQLDSSRQNWLFGAGISFNSNIPLMYPLTDRVKKIIDASSQETEKTIYAKLSEELETDAHIEHYLSHLGDLIALADRTRSKKGTISGEQFELEDLTKLYQSIIVAIGDTVRYGYSKNGDTETIGTSEKPIIEIEHHLEFIKAIFSNRANLLSRSKITFFTTNYDTLLEDALGIEGYSVIDGFSGGAVGYWNPKFEFQETSPIPNKCSLFKLHGSIDWQRSKDNGLYRVRYGTKYFEENSDIMIYPQATKYVETQKDPFSYLFNGFRSALNHNDDNVLITCGYSFGDEHINSEIEAALLERDNRTTLVAFIQERPEGDVKVHPVLDQWLKNDHFGNRVYIAGEKGIYYNSINPIPPASGENLKWWQFAGLTTFISTGDYE